MSLGEKFLLAQNEGSKGPQWACTARLSYTLWFSLLPLEPVTQLEGH